MTITRREFIEQFGGLAAAASLSSLMAAEDPANRDAVRTIGSNRVLLVDQEFIAKSAGVRLKLHPPRKTGERLVESEHPWESATLNWFSVLQDGGKYRMWYECYDVDGWPTADDTSFCYAESTDGIHWIKPKLGLFSYQGSKDNNILFRQVGDGKARSRVHGIGVFLDPSAPPEARYKCVAQGQFQGIAERPHFIAGMTSPDGLNWTRISHPICLVFADSQYSGYWDSDRKQYAIYGRVSGRGGRAIGRSTSKRFDSFAPLALALEKAETHPPDADLYNPACVKYPGDAELYLMFPSLFRHQADTLDIRLAVSRDGVKWTWPEIESPFIPLGKPTDFDGGSLYMGNGGCLRTGDELSFYFSGSSLKHEEVDLKQLTEPKNRRVISRAAAPIDRLVSVTADKAEGSFETPPIRFSGSELLLHATVQTSGKVRVGLLTAEGQSIPGHGIDDCRALQGDQRSWTVAWGGGQDLSAWSGQPIRLRIALQDSDVFGFQFVNAVK